MKIIAGIKVEHIRIQADIDKDGKIGLEDVVFILQKILETR